MAQYNKMQLRGSIKPMGINQLVLSREPFVPTALTTVNCHNCGWQGAYGEGKIALWIDPIKQTSPAYGGDGRNYYCPKCRTWLASTRGVNAELK